MSRRSVQTARIVDEQGAPDLVAAVKADEHVAERARSLALAGDRAGVDRWLAIADCLDKLRDGGPIL